MALKFQALLDDHNFQWTLIKMKNAANNAASAMRRDFDTLTDALPGGGLLARLGPGGAAAGGIVSVLGGIAAAGDNIATAFSRINAATGNMDQSQAVLGTLRDLASETGVAVSESAGQFSRFSIAARQIGATNEQIVTLIGLMQKAGVVGGSNAEEIASAGVQMGQALASGRLQGDELRSIMENMPLLAEQLAKNLNVSVGELRAMSKEGLLTTDVVFPALLASASDIEEKFSQMPVTMSRAWASFRNEALGFLADVDNRALGVSRMIAGTLEGLQGFGPGDRQEIAKANRLKQIADAEADRLFAEQTERRTGFMNKEPAPITDRKHEQDAKDTKEVIKRQAAEAKKAADEEIENARKITEAYHDSAVQRLHDQEQLRIKSNEAADERARNAELEGQRRLNQMFLEAAEATKAGWQNQLDQAENIKTQIDNMGPDDRREAIRDKREQDWKDKQNERIRKGGKDARFGARELQEDIDKGRKAVAFAQGEIDKLTAAIEKLITK